jgi:hypothetical protein
MKGMMFLCNRESQACLAPRAVAVQNVVNKSLWRQDRVFEGLEGERAAIKCERLVQRTLALVLLTAKLVLPFRVGDVAEATVNLQSAGEERRSDAICSHATTTRQHDSFL